MNIKNQEIHLRLERLRKKEKNHCKIYKTKKKKNKCSSNNNKMICICVRYALVRKLIILEMSVDI